MGMKWVPESKQKYTFPFSHECRAFARLDSMGENGTWAVKCHGWIKLSDEQFHPIRKQEQLSRWAIVKDYIPNEIALKDVPEIRRQMAIARRAGLYPQDVKPENYRGSFLVDLGRVRTYPYPIRLLCINTHRRRFFELFDEEASDWQECIKDGEIVPGWVNRARLPKSPETIEPLKESVVLSAKEQGGANETHEEEKRSVETLPTEGPYLPGPQSTSRFNENGDCTVLMIREGDAISRELIQQLN